MPVNMRRSSLAWICVAVLAGCGSSAGDGAGGSAGGVAGAGGGPGFDCEEPEPGNCPEMPPSTIDAERPAEVVVPSDYTTSTRYPLVIMLHAGDVPGEESATYLGAFDRVDSRQFVLVVPSGTVNAEGTVGWTSSDVGYVLGLIEEARATYRLDGERVYLMGSADGATLALGIICAEPTAVTAILSQAGALPVDAACAEGTVSLLSVHGTADGEVPFGGGTLANDTMILSAVNLVAGFAERSGCGPFATPPNIDLVPPSPVAETRVRSYSDCDQQAEIALWAVQEGPHFPDFTDDAPALWFDWIFARARPE